MFIQGKVSVTPPPYTDHNDKIVQPEAIVFDGVLDPTYSDSPLRQTVSVNIQGIPHGMTIIGSDEYVGIGDYTQEYIEGRLRSYLGEDIGKTLRALYPKTLEEDPTGPGTILTNMISTLGIKSSSTCSCRRHALQMNEQGPEWCKNNMSTILEWLKDESSKRNLPFIETVAKMMVNRAISQSIKKTEALMNVS